VVVSDDEILDGVRFLAGRVDMARHGLRG
jgi:hypothetical protein